MRNEKWMAELERLEGIISLTGLKREIKWGVPVYTYEGKHVVSFGGFKNYFALWFYNGVFLTDARQVLIAASEKTKALRQWRFTAMDQLDEQLILSYIQEAVEVEKKGLKIPVDKGAYERSEVLQAALDSNQTLKQQFEALTPGRQKEYHLYLQEVKQEATKHKRLEKIIPLILAGQGLHDKYK